MPKIPVLCKPIEETNLVVLNSVMVGDCLDSLKRAPSEFFHLTVFSPPYDGIRDYKDNWTLDYQSLGAEIFRTTVEGGVCAVVIGDGTKNFAKSLTTFRWAVDWCDRLGWKLFETCIYSRHGNPGAWWSQRFRVDHEYILIFFKGKRPRVFNKEPLMIDSKHAGKIFSGTDRLTNGDFKKIDRKAVNAKKCRGTVWNYATSNTEGNRLKLKHPATYPDKLAEDLIDCFSRAGDFVLDPMAGSGTTCVAAAKLDRLYVGMEISPEYAKIAEQRIAREAFGRAGRLL
ncbi:site-specific DNA-methyltransferase [soil metagenome]